MLGPIFQLLALAVTPATEMDQSYLQGSPINQAACYRLDRNNSRTSATIRGGQGQIRVVSKITLPNGAPGYEVDFTYNLSVLLTNTAEGVIRIKVPADYFTNNFFSDLRNSHTYQGPTFKIDYLGSETVTTLDRQTFSNTNRGHVYDIDTREYEELLPLANDFAQAVSEATGEPVQESGQPITDLELWIDATPLLPAIGAARVDVIGKMYGLPFKAGIDYTTDRTQCP